MTETTVQLGDHVDILSGFAFKSAQFNSDGHGLPLIRIRDVTSGNSDTFYSGEYEEVFLIDDGDLLIGMDGDFNREIWSGGKALLNQRVCKVSAREASLDRRFLYHLLPKELEKIHARTPAVTVKHLSVKAIRAIELPLPTIDEQKRIAAILDKADNLRRKRQQSIQLADEFLRAVFLDMFGDPVANSKNWDVRLLKDMASKIGSGATPRGGKEAYQEEGISLIRSLNIHDNSFFYKDLAHINEDQADRLSNVVVESGDVLLNITGASVCRCAIVEDDSLPARVNQHVCIIRPKSLPSSYLLHLLISGPYKRHLLNMAGAGGATREALTKQQVESLRIPVPPVEMLNKFDAICSRLENLGARTDRFLEEPIFESLSQKAFSGEL